MATALLDDLREADNLWPRPHDDEELQASVVLEGDVRVVGAEGHGFPSRYLIDRSTFFETDDSVPNFLFI